ncbi:hypothetical protein F3Y22_tig00111131pilonHSYRG00159 [Hibiscus syriacus]|uniref:Reverse transcriptase zinc-binding domain-containing protein n=1 Tax=Hibiscus syriacus TaxID=106335 RepID=A0A6A2YXV6_HIBSY|nr:hypothetical protein F3Y22_tig00111131pilonHSYRG00159 [Hibiscus syriacus]
MAYENGNWRWDLFQNLLWWNILLRIAALKGSKASMNRDCVGWSQGKDNEFTIKSAYTIRIGGSPDLHDPIWKRIHHYRGIQRIKIFMWLACQGKLMSNDEMARRHFTSDTGCFVCTNGTETIDHVLMYCPPALAIWNDLIKNDKLHEFFNLDFRDWIGQNITTGAGFAKNQHDWDLLFVAIIWNLWCFLNSVVFYNEDMYNGSILNQSCHLAGIIQ